MEVRLPNLGEGADVGVVVSILVKVGEEITEGQNLIELETGKAVASIPASAAGKLESIRVKVGDKITPGTVLVSLAGGVSPAPVPAAKPQPANVTPPPAEAAEPEPRVEVVSLGSDPLENDDLEEAELPAFPPPASPSLRKMARELGIDLRRVKGSEYGGRILMEDVKKYVQGLIQTARQAKALAKAAVATKTAKTGAPAAVSPGFPPVSLDFSQWGEVSKKPLSPLRQVIAKRMLESASTLPQVTQFEEADITDLLALRKKYAAAYEANGAKLTLTGLAIRVVVAALQKYPLFNTSLDEVTQEMVRKHYFHIGIAVDTEAGLLVPVLRNADQKSLLALSLELEKIAELARDRKLAPADMQGGSFTISNQGAIGGGYFTPIVNKPEAAILGLGKGALRPLVLADGKIEARMVLPLGLSYDHRLIDGASAARFVVELRRGFENFAETEVKL